jgi:hypothetical protein
LIQVDEIMKKMEVPVELAEQIKIIIPTLKRWQK